jgi:hypothetical protein
VLSPEAAQAAASVSKATRDGALVTAKVIEGLLGDDLARLPAYVRGLMLSGALKLAGANGFTEVSTQADWDALGKLFGRSDAFLTQTLNKELRAILGDTAFEKIATRAAGANQSLADYLGTLPADIYTTDALVSALEAKSEVVAGEAPLSTALSRFATRLKGLPFAVTQSVEAKLEALITQFGPLFPGMSEEEIIGQADFLAQADIAMQQAMDSLIGDDELAQEVIGLYGGIEAFFKAFASAPSLRALDAKQLTEWISKNARNLVQNIPGADITRVTQLLEAQALAERQKMQRMARAFIR